MRLESPVNRAILKELAKKYKKVRKKEKTGVLEKFIGLTGKKCRYMSQLLPSFGQKVILSGGDAQRKIFISKVRKVKRRRGRVYEEKAKGVLILLGKLLD